MFVLYTEDLYKIIPIPTSLQSFSFYAFYRRFLFKHILGIRRLGAAALDLCYVACGRAAGFWEFELSPWDFCAGKLIVEEAGGRVTDNSGKPAPLTEKGFIVASNSRLHGRMLRIISQA